MGPWHSKRNLHNAVATPCVPLKLLLLPLRHVKLSVELDVAVLRFLQLLVSHLAHEDAICDLASGNQSAILVRAAPLSFSQSDYERANRYPSIASYIKTFSAILAALSCARSWEILKKIVANMARSATI